MAEVDMRKGYDPVTILIFDRKKNITVEEISLIAFDKENHKVIAAGNEVLSIMNHLDQTVLVTSPLKNGMIADFMSAQVMFRHILKKIICAFINLET